MFPGSTTKITEETITAATTISPKADMVHLVGNTAVANIKPNFGGGFSGILLVVPDEAVATTTAGNISLVVTMPANRVTVLVYSKLQNKWYPGAIS